MTDVWRLRLERAEKLSSLWPFAREVLGFYRALTELQRELHIRLPPRDVSKISSLSCFFPPLFMVIAKRGPRELAARAERWREQPEEWKRALVSFWKGEKVEPLEDFFPKAILQPHALELARLWRVRNGGPPEASFTGACPFCGHPPAVSVVREEKGPEGAARSLICSLCSLEWGFSRILCPECLVEDPEKLPRYTAEEIPWVRVEACDACGRYLKTVDLTRNGDALPLVDELASTPLDVLAAEKGYIKLEPNMAGI